MTGMASLGGWPYEMHAVRCTRCGARVEPGDGVWTEDYVYCDACEAQYEAWFGEEYPYGQCQECGAVGRLLDNGEIYFPHPEGMCSQWRDHGDDYYEPYDG